MMSVKCVALWVTYETDGKRVEFMGLLPPSRFSQTILILLFCSKACIYVSLYLDLKPLSNIIKARPTCRRLRAFLSCTFNWGASVWTTRSFSLTCSMLQSSGRLSGRFSWGGWKLVWLTAVLMMPEKNIGYCIVHNDANILLVVALGLYKTNRKIIFEFLSRET